MPNRSDLSVVLACSALFCALFWPATPAQAAPKVANPDLTAGGAIPEEAKHDWNLGATGARGWMYSDRLVTTDARQVAITKVEPGSPAEGVLQVGDVLLGVGGERFGYDPRTEIGKALTRAESHAQGGRLVVTRWRAGKTQDVEIGLPVLGSYSKTAPYHCAKSRRVFEQGCAALAEAIADPSYKRNPIERSYNALALLASGKEEYRPLLKREAEHAAASTPGGYQTWWYGPVITFLAEYVIATGDKSVMPGLERLTLEAAKGQSAVGSWGHRFALGSGRLSGYGMMNAPGVPLTTGLVLAREAGVDDPALDLAIERSVRLLRFYVGKGCIPYGDHHPWIQTHDDNGKNGMAAVLFNLLGDIEAAEYFSRMSVASHGAERDCGHTGNFFNIQWAVPGVNLSGPHATGAWMKEFGGWYFDLARQHDGTFRHQGPPKLTGDRYRNWDTTGVYLLAYAMPLKKVRLTGKGQSAVPRLGAGEASSLIADGRGWDNKDRNSFYDKLSEAELVERLSSWSPIVRERAAMALGRSEAEATGALLELLGSEDLYSRYGACQALKHCRGERASAVPALTKTLEADDLWLRILAADALAGIGEPAKAAVPKLLERLAKVEAENDPRRMEQRYLCFALFNGRGGLISRSLEGVDRELLLDAVRVGLKNEDGRARGSIGSVYRQLTLDEIRPLLPAVYQAVVEPAPSGVMFASGIRIEGLNVLARHRVSEGIDAAVYLLEHQNGWGSNKRTPSILKALTSYGANAQRAIPELERIAELLAKGDPDQRKRASPELEQAVRDAIEQVKASNDRPDLIEIGQDQLGRAGDE